MNVLISKIKSRLNSEEGFLKAVLTLVGGTAFVQLVNVLVLPILTRLYTPEDFAVFAIYTSTLGMLSVASCLRFEIAIAMPEKDEDAISLLIAGLVSNLIITFLITLVLYFFNDRIFQALDRVDLIPYTWLLPVGVFLFGIYNCLQYWATRKKRFKEIVQTKVSQVMTGSIVQIGGGILKASVYGLILGQIFNMSSGIIRLFYSFIKDTKNSIKKVNLKTIKKNVIVYQDFPKYSTFEALFNTSGTQLPIIIIGFAAGGATVGFLMIASRVMAIPIRLLGSSIAQVYLSFAPAEYSKGNLERYTLQTMGKIAKYGLIPLILICFAAPVIFPIVLGKQWAEAGNMVLWMLPWFMAQLLSSPVSMSLQITNNQKTALFLQFLGLLIRSVGLLVFVIYYAEYAFEYFAISSFVFYCIYIIVICKIIRNKAPIVI